jgi:hypothetical protein
MNEPWFPHPELFATLYGSLAGGVGGTLLGLLGAAAGTLAPQGKGRGFVLGAMLVFLVLGVLQLLFGLAALSCRQPYAIWYPPLLCGAIATILMTALRPVVRRHYDAAEQRRLEAEGIRHQF